jgi:hypothetical protein
MIPLNDPRWQSYVGGYQVAFDASMPLMTLLSGEDAADAIEVLKNELCHQGTLGSASYAAVPWLVEYQRRCPDLDAEVVGLVLAVEFARPFNRLEMPEELQLGYQSAIRDLPEIVLSKRNGPWDDGQVLVGAACLALGQSNRWFARTYFELDRAMLDHIIEREFGTSEWNWP